VTKQRWGAFAGTTLDRYLRERGVTQIVLTGIATSIGVESTARNAYDHGYNVMLVVDAMTDLHADAHRHSVEKIFPRLGESTTTGQLLRLLEVSGQCRGAKRSSFGAMEIRTRGYPTGGPATLAAFWFRISPGATAARQSDLA